MLLELKTKIIYGPVKSRRLGRSLGLNILPAGRKVCSFNCVYCQYGWKTPQEFPADKTLNWPSPAEVGEALAEALRGMSASPAYITFSGNGEATLHPFFTDIVEKVIRLRNRMAPDAKTAILSNSSLVPDPAVHTALQKLDVRIMKLDCGLDKNFRSYNQPAYGITLDRITNGLAQIPDVTIQSLFTKGSSGNFSAANIQAWIERLITIKPRFVQLYSLDRDAPDAYLRPAAKMDLAGIKSQVTKAGIPAEFY